jgi:hypothetical protein
MQLCSVSHHSKHTSFHLLIFHTILRFISCWNFLLYWSRASTNWNAWCEIWCIFLRDLASASHNSQVITAKSPLGLIHIVEQAIENETRNWIEGLEQVVNVWLHTPLILYHMTNLITLIKKVESTGRPIEYFNSNICIYRERLGRRLYVRLGNAIKYVCFFKSCFFKMFIFLDFLLYFGILMWVYQLIT